MDVLKPEISPVACTCGECFKPDAEGYPRVFDCPTCNRVVPWCFGATDAYEDICDDCWSIADRMHTASGNSLDGWVA